ncbi:carboxylesterase/lipase family protein [Streptomyces luteireticuli]|uniref:carboxylesterase/lipase family protein n=1 Tax=Streptomyces luteireticuli TaxID=173858 RepID=UPI0035586AE1
MPVVNTGSGPVRGVEEGPVAAFRGVPYAASPVGELRFAAPQPHPGWSGVRDAARPGPAVPQEHSRLEAVMGARPPDWDEDGCLNLNVWTPLTALAGTGAGAGAAEPRPVLVWFHGGGWSSGSGGWDWYDGGRLAALGGIVVVTANYRIGPLGYLHLPSIGADNLGPQDQGAVLRWVRDNIAAFGGDPGLVTVGGQSAGAYSSLHLAIDPGTSGLVRRMIVQSGPLGLAPQDPVDADGSAAAYLRVLGVDRADDPGRALRALSIEELLDAYQRLAAVLDRPPGDIAPPMWPVLGHPGTPRTWQQAVADGALDGKDVLIGTVADEMTAFLAFDPRMRDLTRDGALGLLAGLTGRLGPDAPAAYERYEAERPGAAPDRVYTDLATDRVFRDGGTRIAAHRAAQGAASYLYRFTRRPDPDEHGLRATHCCELPFLFGTFETYPDAPMLGPVGDRDRTLGRAFGGALAAFVATGSPNGDGLAQWRPYGPGPDTNVMCFGLP